MATLDEHQALIRAFVEALAYAERSPAFRKQMRDHYRRIQRTVARLVEAALGPNAAANGADPMVIALFLIAVFDGLAVQFRMAPEDTPSGERLVDEGPDDTDHDEHEHRHAAADDAHEDAVAPGAAAGAGQKRAGERQPLGRPSPGHALLHRFSARPGAACPGRRSAGSWPRSA